MTHLAYCSRLFLRLSLFLLFVPGCGGGGSDEIMPSNTVLVSRERIVLASSDAGFGGVNTVAPDGSDRRLILPDDDASSPSFTSDGTKIRFYSTRNNCGGVGCQELNGGVNTYLYPAQLWEMNTDGTGLRQLTRRRDDEYIDRKSVV